MTVEIPGSSPSRTQINIGYAFSILVILFMLMDGVMKFTHAAPVLEASRQLEIPLSLNPMLGVIALACVVLYAIPATAVLGAILFTGYFGGAIAIHWRVGNPLFTHILFPIYVALFLWGGLWFRDHTLRDLFPIVKHPGNSATSKAALYTGYGISVLAALVVFLTAVIKFVYTPPADAPPPIFPMEHIHTLGYMELILTALYLMPGTTFFGAVFLTGYLGGAAAIGLRTGQGASGALIPVGIGVALWAGYWLRNAKVRALIPLRKK